MRLKDILLENSKKSVDEFIQLVKTGDWLFREPVIYRGRDQKPSFNFEVREKRKSREPKDTREIMDNVISCLHSVFLPDFPHRSRSTFGTHSLTVALDYGTYYMLVIPHKSAKISWAEKDAWWSFFKDAGINLKTVLEYDPESCLDIDSSKAREHQQIITDTIKALTQASQGKCGGLKKYKEKYGGNPFNNTTMFMTLNNKLNFEPGECFLAAKKTVNYIFKYLDNLHLGYPPDQESFYEAVVEGPYLYVSMKFLRKHEDRIKNELDVSFETRRDV